MSYARTYSLHVALSLMNTVIGGAVFYGLRILLYHRLDTNEYAWFYSAMALVMVLHPFLAVGFDPGLAPFVTQLREADRFGLLRVLLLRVLAIETIVAAVITAAIALAAPQLSSMLIGGPEAAPALRILGLYLAAVLIYKVAITALLGLQHIAARTAVESLRAFGIAGAAWFIVTGAAQEAAIAYTAATAAAAATGLAALPLLRPALIRAPAEPLDGLAARVFHSGKYASFAFGGIMIFSQMDTLMLGLLRRDNEIAIASYQVAAPTFMVLYSLLIAVTVNFMPMAALLHARGERDRLAQGVSDIQRLGACTILPLSAAVAAFAPLLIETLFRREAPGAPEGLAILAAGAYWSFAAYLHLNTLAGVGETRAAASAVAAGLAANLLLNILLVPPFNLLGAAVATVLATGLVALMARRRASRVLPLRPVWPSGLAGTLLALAALPLHFGLKTTDLFQAEPLIVAVAGVTAIFGLSVVSLMIAKLCPRPWSLVRSYRAMTPPEV